MTAGKSLRNWRSAVALLLFILSCAAPAFAASQCAKELLSLGSRFDSPTRELRFRLFSSRATKVQVSLYSDPYGDPVGSYFLEKTKWGDIWTVSVPSDELERLGLIVTTSSELARPVYYGYRLWGPNWVFHGEWKPGSDKGFIVDVDADGNRFNPNKLVLDPYALEVSHDPRTEKHPDDDIYYSGPETRNLDSGPIAPKAVVIPEAPASRVAGPERPFKDEVIYEAHVRGLTMNDPDIPESERGTFRGAARKAKYLKSLGVTAIELMPPHEFQADLNREVPHEANNYWGYMTLGFFSPDRRYATAESRRKLGGVAEEFRDMVDAFHAEGLKVYIDVVFNHTAEGGAWGPSGETAKILSFRGIDNAAYYQTGNDKRRYQDNTGCGPNMNAATKPVRDLVIDSLRYFRHMGVDGFRFDLAAVLGNIYWTGNRFYFDKMPGDNVLNRALRELPARPAKGGPGIDLIAEPWGVGPGTYQAGQFPSYPDRGVGWAEWNGKFRDAVRRALNRFGYGSPPPAEMAMRIAGSYDLFGSNLRKPWHSVNFITSHDGFTLKDLFSYNEKQNGQPPPYGPSDGGEDRNFSWDQAFDGDTPAEREGRQRQAARNAMATLMLSIGVPMMNGGDEFLRTQRGNNNMWNIDSRGSWIDWRDKKTNAGFFQFMERLLAFRRKHPAFRPAEYPTGEDRDGLRAISWYQADGRSAEDRDLPPGEKGYMNDPDHGFLGYRLDARGSEGESPLRSIYVAINWSPAGTKLKLPPPAPGKRWYWAGDTDSRFEASGNFAVTGEERLVSDLGDGEDSYAMAARSVAVFIEK